MAAQPEKDEFKLSILQLQVETAWLKAVAAEDRTQLTTLAEENLTLRAQKDASVVSTLHLEVQLAWLKAAAAEDRIQLKALTEERSSLKLQKVCDHLNNSA